MKKNILFVFIFFTTALSAQQKGLLAFELSTEKTDTLKHHLFVIGEQVKIICPDSILPEPVEGKITAISDSTVAIDSLKKIDISTICLMGYKTPRKIRLRRAVLCVVSCAVMVGSAVVIATEADGETGPTTEKERLSECLFVSGMAGTATFLVLALQKYTMFGYPFGLQLLKK